MALISCKECNKEMSDSAQSCPHCGYTYSNQVKVDINSYEITNKRWKGKQVSCCASWVVAFIIGSIGTANSGTFIGEFFQILAFTLFGVGIIFLIIGVIGHWWERG